MFRIQSMIGSGFLGVVSSPFSVASRRISSLVEQSIRGLSAKVVEDMSSRWEVERFLNESQRKIGKLIYEDLIIRNGGRGSLFSTIEKRRSLVEDLKEQQQKLRTLLPNITLSQRPLPQGKEAVSFLLQGKWKEIEGVARLQIGQIAQEYLRRKEEGIWVEISNARQYERDLKKKESDSLERQMVLRRTEHLDDQYREVTETQKKINKLLQDLPFCALPDQGKETSLVRVDLDKEQKIHRLLTSWIGDLGTRHDVYRKATTYIEKKYEKIVSDIVSATSESTTLLNAEKPLTEGMRVQELLVKRSELIDELLVASEQWKSLLALVDSYEFRR